MDISAQTKTSRTLNLTSKSKTPMNASLLQARSNDRRVALIMGFYVLLASSLLSASYLNEGLFFKELVVSFILVGLLLMQSMTSGVEISSAKATKTH